MALSLIPLINGRRYGWADIEIQIDGTPVRGVTSIEYSEEVESELDYGSGKKPKGTVFGREKCGGKITLNTELVQLLREAASAFRGSIVRLPSFVIIVSFELAPGLPLTTHKLLGCNFTKDEVKFSEGDMKYEQELDLMIREIIWI